MKTKLQIVTSNNLKAFITSKPVAILYASSDGGVSFNGSLKSGLEQHFKLQLALGAINNETVDYVNPVINFLITKEMPRLGLPVSQAFIPGYYLFRNGLLIAYHPGTFDISKLSEGQQNVMAITAAGIMLLSALLTKDLGFTLQSLGQSAQLATGMNILEFFRRFSTAYNTTDTRPAQLLVYKTELERAYQLLGVSPLASDKEINSARKDQLKQYHPDKSLTDKEARTQITVEINRAYDFIKSTRENVRESTGI